MHFVAQRMSLDFAVRGDFINWEEATARLALPGGGEAVVAAPVEEEGSAAKVLFGKERGVRIPWDETLRLVEVRHILAIVDEIPEEALQ